VEQGEAGCEVVLDGGERLPCDLLVVGVGVQPVTGFLLGSGVELDRGVLVDDTMRSSVANIFAAGDVAQARGFYDGARTLNGILPDAVEQGRIAGMAAAISGSMSSLIAIVTGTLIGQQYDGMVIVLAAGFSILGLAAFVMTEWAERRRA